MIESDAPDPLGELIRYGTVTSVDLAAARCVVEIGDVETGPIRWAEVRLGAVKIWCPPSEGEQVLVFCPEGDIAGAVVMGAIPSDDNPANGDSTKIVITLPDGAVISYDPEESDLSIVLPEEGKATVDAQGGIKLIGDVEIEGKLKVTEDADFGAKIHATGEIKSDDDVIAGTVKLKSHKHSGVTAGAAQSGVPVP